VVAAVSDGHGAPAHFRSGEGARIAVDTAVHLLAWHLDDGEEDGSEGTLGGTIVSAWRRAVGTHLAENPFDAAQQSGSSSPYSPYGATLLTLAANQDIIAMLQIGDGDLMLGYPDGRIERPLRSDEGLVGEQTYSLCQNDAEGRFRVASLWRSEPSGWPDFALLSSDGVSKSFRDDEAFEDAVRRLRALASSQWQETLAALPQWLSDVSANGSGDDSTICIVIRPPSAQTDMIGTQT
jgi:serine/threonine protein phosphatase PrpC